MQETERDRLPSSATARRLAALTLRLVEIPSVTGEERAIADWVEGFVRRLDKRHAVRRHGNALVVVPVAEVEAPVVGLFGHLDTVPPAEDQPRGMQAGRVYGRGAADMKAGLAWMLHLLEVPWSPTRARPVLVFYDREEGPMADNGLARLLEEQHIPPLDVALVLEPTAGRIEAGCSGSIHARVTVLGKAVHSARPWLGKNAVYRARPLLDHLAAFGRRAVRVGEMTYYEVMTVTQLWTSNARNVTPAQAILNINYRFAPGRSLEAAAEVVRREVSRAFEGTDVPRDAVQVEVVDAAPAGDDASGHPVIARWRRERGLALAAKQGWTDVARLTAAGIPAVNFGPGDPSEAHQARESVAVDALAEGFQHLEALFR